jgi:putative ABC transport system permease protein
MWRTTLRGLLAHKLRLGLTALAIVLGVGFVAGTYVLTDTMNRTFDDLVSEGVAGVDVYVRSESAFMSLAAGQEAQREPIDESLLAAVQEVEGVRVAAGSVAGYAQLVDKQGEAIVPTGPPTLGVSWPPDQALSPYSLRDGRAPVGEGEVAIDARTARQYGFRVGDPVTVQFLEPSGQFRVVGIVGYGEADNLAGATLAVFELETAQTVLGRVGEYDTIDVAAEEGVSAQALRDRIAEVLPERTEAITGGDLRDELTSDISEALGFFQTALLVFAAVALFVGSFIIFNTFSILITQRTRELALLRAVGASARQVMRSVLAESLIVGVVASVIGLGAGLLIAVGLQSLLDAFGFSVPSTGLQVLPRTIVVALGLGITVAVASSILPARRASRISPMAALRDVDAVRPTSLRTRSAAAIVIVLLGIIILALGLFAGAGISLVGGGVALIFVAVAVASPLLARPLTRFIGAPVARLRGVPGRLGRENAMRNPRRTASTSSALMIGLALVGTFAILGQSVKASVAEVIEGVYRADFILNASQGLTTFSPEVAERLRSLDQVSVVSQSRLGVWRPEGEQSTQFLNGVDPLTVEEVLDLGVVDGSIGDLGNRGVAVHQSAADERGLGVGDVLRMEFAATGVVPMPVVAVFEETALESDYAISLAAHEANFPDSPDSTVLVRTSPGVSASEARNAIEGALESFPNVEVRNQSELRESQEQQINQALGLISALLGLAILIALLGIVNTLALSVLERTRELGLLRAVGMSRRQVRAMVRWESVIIALLGGILGLGVGVFFGWILVTALADEGIEVFAVPGVQLAVFLVLAGLAGVLAAVLPARRAARMDVLTAVTVE